MQTSVDNDQEPNSSEASVAPESNIQQPQLQEAQQNMKKYAGGAGALADLLIIVIIGGISIYEIGILAGLVLTLVVLIIVLSLSVRVVSQWNRMAVLRFGRYKGMIGPGIYFIIPIVDHTPFNVDLRVISTPFSAEKTLTKDNVPVDVDAILFWQVRNPEHAVLNVQNYMQSVQLASQTAMRDIIGKNDLSLMLAGRDIIGEDIRKLIQERIESWGIVAISVEIRDVTIPPELQSAMARVATSDREKQARVILAESESLAADKMLEAAEKYRKDLYAMQLRSLNMMYEISLSGKNLIVFVPTEAKGFSIPTPFGVMGLQDYYKQQQQGGAQSSSGQGQQSTKGKGSKPKS
ncbi:MAG: SPFH domain-containing protein [Candidatus Marsarchaeota archaeon]|jgi:regulator of protease activity HflC (stomatin/prohibitin superfamily)|nr:SPFH domain-containing protein [Candidatus Marsarchaeota archaeon]MCL5418789.1 SPFH domain-containing protein [Candidatus Marsarchaeota archaeon]